MTRRFPNPKNPYQAGYDCGQSGADTTNCNIHWFSSPSYTSEWEAGKAQAEADAREAQQ